MSEISDDGFTIVASRKSKKNNQNGVRPVVVVGGSGSNGSLPLPSSAAVTPEDSNSSPTTKSQRRGKLVTQEISLEEATDRAERAVLAARQRLPESLLLRLESLLLPVVRSCPVSSIVSYGLGQPSQSNVSAAQLAILLHLKDSLGLPTKAYDPCFNNVDWSLLSRFGITQAEDPLSDSDSPTKPDFASSFLFMPHCELPLYLAVAPTAHALLGNSFTSYLDRRKDASPLTEWTRRGGTELPLNIDPKQDGQEAWLSLHDCALHWIPASESPAPLKGSEIRLAQGKKDMETVEALFREYQDAADAPICFVGFEAELKGLPGDYAEPRGCILLAEKDGEPVGVVAIRPFKDRPAIAEMKRLFLRPTARGFGLGKRLALQIVSEAKSRGFEKMALETLESMETAKQIYEAIGFTQCTSPVQGSEGDIEYFELVL